MSAAPEVLENPENSQENGIQKKIYDLQLQYVDNLMKGRTPLPDALQHSERPKLGELLASYTNLRRELMFQYMKRSGEEGGPEDPRYAEFADTVYASIRDCYDPNSDSWTSKIREIVAREISHIPKAEHQDSTPYEKKFVGLLSHNLNPLSEMRKHAPDSFLVKELSEHGLTDKDECLSLHLEPLAKQKAKDESGVESLFSKNSLSKVAEDIVENEQATRAVVGVSWLLDSPVGQRVGFHVGERMPLNGSLGTWYQFLDKDGNLKEDEVQAFLETGKPRFFERQGYMLTEEFLKKYLPEEKRGVVHLKKTKEGFDQELEDDQVLLKIVALEWSMLTNEKVIATLNNTKIFSRYLQTESGKKLLELMLAAKEKGLGFEESRKLPEIEAFKDDFDIFLQKDRYEEYSIEV